MFERIWTRLENVPRWLIVLWALAGPFLGMFLRELLKDRFYSGINAWLDQTFGPALSTLASGVLWIIWMALLGAVLLLVWKASEAQVVGLQKYPAPSRPDGNRRDEAVASTLPRQLSPYEAEQKLRAINAALKILREDIPPVLHSARQLEGSAGNAFRRIPRDDQAYFAQLADCRDQLRYVFTAIEDRRQRHPEYRDISAALQQPAEGLSLEGALGNYLANCQALFTYLDQATPVAAFNQLMSHSTNELIRIRETMERWRDGAERQSIALHETASSRT